MADLLARATDADLEEARRDIEYNIEYMDGRSSILIDTKSGRLAAECIEIVRELRQSGAAKRAADIVDTRHTTALYMNGEPANQCQCESDAALLRRLLPEGESE